MEVCQYRETGWEFLVSRECRYNNVARNLRAIFLPGVSFFSKTNRHRLSNPPGILTSRTKP